MTLSKEYYDYEMSIVQTDPETGKLSLSHIPVDDPRLKKLQKLARSKRNKKIKNKELPKVVNITNRGKKFYDCEDVSWDVIRTNRTAKNLTQHEVATMAGLSKAVYQQYEIGRKRPTKKRIVDICNVLDLRVKEHKGNTMRIGKKNCESIRSKRIAKGYNQKEFSKMVGIAQGSYCGFETDRLVWNERVLKNTCELLEIDYKDVTMNAR